MKKKVILLSAAIVVILTLVIVSLVLAKGPTEALGSTNAQGLSQAGGTDSNPVGTPEVVIPKEYQPKAGSAPQAAGPVSIVYFTPQDEDASDTILFLYSTNPLTSTVRIQTYYINGSLTVSTTVSVPPNGLLRVSADMVTTVSASWKKYAYVNFTTYSAYGKLTLPPGVKADGYVAWDTAGFYDPLTAMQTLPLRFSIDPPTIFLPTIQR